MMPLRRARTVLGRRHLKMRAHEPTMGPPVRTLRHACQPMPMEAAAPLRLADYLVAPHQYAEYGVSPADAREHKLLTAEKFRKLEIALGRRTVDGKPAPLTVGEGLVRIRLPPTFGGRQHYCPVSRYSTREDQCAIEALCLCNCVLRSPPGRQVYTSTMQNRYRRTSVTHRRSCK